MCVGVGGASHSVKSANTHFEEKMGPRRKSASTHFVHVSSENKNHVQTADILPGGANEQHAYKLLGVEVGRILRIFSLFHEVVPKCL